MHEATGTVPSEQVNEVGSVRAGVFDFLDGLGLKIEAMVQAL